MIIQKTSIPKPGKPGNDDIAGHYGRIFWLMDGATQLQAPAHGLNAEWQVRRLAAEFAQLAAQAPEIDLAEMAAKATETVGQEFYAQSGLSSAASMMERPFCTLILCRLNTTEDVLEYLVLCDSTLAVISPTKVTVVTDTRLDDLHGLDKTNALLRQGKGFDTPEYKAELLEAYHYGFRHLNRPGGWDALAQDPAVIQSARRGTINLSPDDHILLMSDGFTRAVDTLGLYAGWREILAAAEQKGLDALSEEIRAAERADSDGCQYPRSSRHDDATVMWIRPGRAEAYVQQNL